MYYRGAKAAVVVYDITNEDTFKGAKSWVKELKTKTTNCIVLLVGNKVDLIETSELNVKKKEFKRKTGKEIWILSTLEKKLVSKIKAKVIKYVS